MDIFNLFADISSILGLGFSFWINRRTGIIQKNIEFAYSAENLLSTFQFDLIKYKKQYTDLFSA